MDAALGAGRHIHIVDADRHLRDDAQLRAGGVQHFGIDPIGDQANDSVHAARVRVQRFALRREIAGPDIELEIGVGAERGEPLARQFAGHEDAGHERLLRAVALIVALMSLWPTFGG